MSERATYADVVAALDAIGGGNTIIALQNGSHPKAQERLSLSLSDLAVLGAAAWESATWDSTGESTEIYEVLLRVLGDARAHSLDRD